MHLVYAKCRWNQKPGQAREGASIPNYENILGDLGAVIDPLGNLIQTIYPFPETYTQNVLYNFKVFMDLPLPPPNSSFHGGLAFRSPRLDLKIP